MDYIKRAQEVLDIETEGLQAARDHLGAEFSQAVDLILDTLKNGGKIVVSGIGKNLHIAEKISATLASTGATSLVLNPLQAMHGDLGVFTSKDILLALSYSGESDEFLTLIPMVRRLEVSIITLTGNTNSSLAKASDIAVPIVITKEACPFNMAPTTSTTATLAVGDALAMVLLDARGFGKEDYAKLHPGGAIGRTLLLRVSDIMRSDERLASIVSGAPVRDALLAMTRARAGSLCVVDTDRNVLGIFTDGDLRRHLADRENVLDLTIDDVMTASPVTVRSDALAVEVLRIFEEHQIDDLLVVDDKKRLIGAVDIQDLPKLKIL